ncbi:MAG TPA: MATE family efflux transporter [Symbiobacteriaceae bacterium]|nr:MATE family efflux transporter [Symbiobacteriaceae bacterium]
MRKELIRLAWPVIGEQVLIMLSGMVGAALAGHLGTVATAAVGFTQPPQWFMSGLFMGLGVGVNAMVARLEGAGDHERIAPATRTVFWLGALLALAMGAAVFAAAPWVIRAAGARPEVVPLGARLLRLMVPGMVAAYWMMMMTAALRATGDTRTSLVINIGVNVINAGLAYGFMYGAFGLPALGTDGAGYATSYARILGAAALLIVLFHRKTGARLYWRNLLRVNWDMVSRIVRVGSVASAERMFSTAIFIVYAAMINGLGTVVAAAQNITVAAESVSWTLGFGFSMATAALTGQRLGANRPDDAEAVSREAAKLSMILLGAVGLFFIAWPGPYLALFTNDPSLLELSTTALRIAGFTEVFTALVYTLNGALSGAGDTRPLFVISTVGITLRLALAAVFIKVFGWGLSGAWLAAGVDWVVRSAMIYGRFQSQAWKAVKV